jgi:hypothetical protein
MATKGMEAGEWKSVSEGELKGGKGMEVRKSWPMKTVAS